MERRTERSNNGNVRYSGRLCRVCGERYARLVFIIWVNSSSILVIVGPLFYKYAAQLYRRRKTTNTFVLLESTEVLMPNLTDVANSLKNKRRRLK